MKHFQSKVLTAAILAALSGSAIAADVYLKDEVYSKEQVDTEITNAKTAVEGKITAAEGKITAAEGKITAAEDKITAAEGKITAAEGKITAAEGKITTLEEKADKAKEAADKAKEAADKAQKGINDIDTKVKAAENAVEKAETAAKKVTDIKEAAGAALLAAYKNAQDINGFKAEDTIYDIDENGKIIEKKATQEDVENDDFAGLGLKEIVGQHDENLENLTETVNKNSETLDNTVDVVNQHTEDLTAVKDAINDTKDDLALVTATAISNAQEINGFKAKDTIYDIDENGKITKKEATEDDVKADDFGGLGLKEVVKANKAAIATKADKTELEKVSDKVTANETAIAKKADQTALDAVSGKVTANETAIAKKADQTKLDEVSKKVTANETAIAKKADQTKLDEVSKKVTANETAIGKKANSADVYTKTESDSRFVKVESSINGLDTTTKGLNTRLVSAEKSVADHGTRLAAAEKSVADHGTRLASAEKSITEHGTRLNGLDKTVSDLRKETRQGLAEQAALSGLFQPYNVGRFNVTAAVGGYKSESAVAIGTGFRFTENFAAKAGVAVGTSSGSSAAYHVGVNYEW